MHYTYMHNAELTIKNRIKPNKSSNNTKPNKLLKKTFFFFNLFFINPWCFQVSCAQAEEVGRLPTACSLGHKLHSGCSS